MPTSNDALKTSEAPDASETLQDPQAYDAPKAHPVRRALLGLLVVLAAIVVADILLCLALEPYGGHAETIWSEYRKTTSLDTVLIGSSTTAYDLDPQPFDEVLGAQTFNMGTPGQTLDNTLMSLETAYADHDVKRVVLCLGYESMTAPPYINSAVAVTQAKCATEGPLEALSDVGRLVFCGPFFSKHFSLTCAFPWTYNHVDFVEGDPAATVDNIVANVRNRMECDLLEASARNSDRVRNSEWYYRSHGFGEVRSSLDVSYAHGLIVANYLDVPFNEYNVEWLTDICDYCANNDIELYVVGSPYPYATVRLYGYDYAKGMERVRKLVTSRGATFFDLNMAHRDLYDPPIEEFSDYGHLNGVGARKAGEVTAQLIARIEQGEDVSSLFYDYTREGWKAYCDSADFIGLTDYEYTVEDGVAHITATCLTGSNTPVEYRLDLVDPKTGELIPVRDYADDPTFTLPVEDRESATIRITVRSAASERDHNRFVQGTIEF